MPHVAVRHRRGVVSAVSLVTSPRIHGRSSHALFAVIVVSVPLSSLMHFCIARCRPYSARNHPSVNYAKCIIIRRNLIDILTYYSTESPKGKVALRGADISVVPNAFCCSLLIYAIAYMYRT